MSLEEIYQEKILEIVLRNFLADNTIPTADQLLEGYDLYVINHSDMTKPFILDNDYSVLENTDSSAALYNSFFENISQDLSVSYQEIFNIFTDSMDSFDNWRLSLANMQGILTDLESRIDALLLLTNDTAGYFNFVEDNLVDLSKVDLTYTTAHVDVQNHACTINETLTNTQRLNLNTLSLKDARFTILTREYIVSSHEGIGTSVYACIQDADRSWQQRVKSTGSDYKISGELKIKISDNLTDISRVEINLLASNLNHPMILTGMYSTDNYNWTNLPCDNYSQSIDSKGLFIFAPIQVKYIKFIMTKLGADDAEDNQYIYEFGSSSVKVFSTAGYDLETGTTLQSVELSVLDNDKNQVKFNKVTLQTCQQTPLNTNIKYWVNAKNDSESTGWLRIDPMNIQTPTAPTILEMGRVLNTSETSLVPVIKTETPSINFFSAFNDLIESDKLILVGTADDTPLALSTTIVSNLIENNIIFYRNVGTPYGTNAVADRYVRDVAKGWKWTDSTKTYIGTTFSIGNSDGLWVDFEDTQAVLDGQTVTGRVCFTKGTHIFQTLVKNYCELPEDSLGPFSTQAELDVALNLTTLGTKKLNHKLLIEGVNYASDYVGVKKYIGTDLYCESIVQRISIFDLLHNTGTSTFNFYSTDITTAGTMVFIVPYDPADTDYLNETFRIDYVTGNNLFDCIEFKAELQSTVNNTTPILNAYRIKLGS